jgi:hypothetical protein
MASSKGITAAAVSSAYLTGLRGFAENALAEFIPRFDPVSRDDHFVPLEQFLIGETLEALARPSPRAGASEAGATRRERDSG